MNVTHILTSMSVPTIIANVTKGITRASTDMVGGKAISATRGKVLMSEGTICDARFSKCCGGAFEEFQYCWENIRHPYLSKQRDSKSNRSTRSV